MRLAGVLCAFHSRATRTSAAQWMSASQMTMAKATQPKMSSVFEALTN